METRLTASYDRRIKNTLVYFQREPVKIEQSSDTDVVFRNFEINPPFPVALRDITLPRIVVQGPPGPVYNIPPTTKPKTNSIGQIIDRRGSAPYYLYVVANAHWMSGKIIIVSASFQYQIFQRDIFLSTYAFGPREAGLTPEDQFYRDNAGLSFALFNNSPTRSMGFGVGRYFNYDGTGFYTDFSRSRYIIDSPNIAYRRRTSQSTSIANEGDVLTPPAPDFTGQASAPLYTIEIRRQTGIVVTMAPFVNTDQHAWRISALSGYDPGITDRRLQSIEDRLTALEA